MILSKSEEHIVQLINDYDKEEKKILVICGGDGTLQLCIEALVKKVPPN